MARRSSLTRRRFLQTGAALAGGLLAPTVFPSGVIATAGRPGPNDRIQIGFIGSGHRAQLLMDQTPKEGRIVALCDVYLKKCADANKKKKQNLPVYQDYRKLLDSKDIEAVFVPTTDHARVLPCIHACQAGMDIYAEKPLTLTIREGRALVNAVRKYKRVFQTGSQQRSMEMNRFACELVRSGGIGKLKEVRGVNYSSPKSCDSVPEEPIPEGLDWEMWLGQAELRPYHWERYRHWWACRSYSGGEMASWGAHGLDQVQWALGMDTSGPTEIWPEGEGANAKVTFRYPNDVLLKLELSRGDGADRGPFGGAVFVGEKGTITIDRNRFSTDPVDLVKSPPATQKAEIWEGPGWQAKYHIGNWLECIRTREKPVADVEIGHRSCTVCHLANITREVGRKLQWDPVNERFVGDEAANRYLDRPRRKGYELPDPV